MVIYENRKKQVKKRKKAGIFFLLLLASVIGLMVYARFIEPNRLTVKSFTVETSKPIKSCRVVFFTDTHFGEFYREDHAEKIVGKINSLNPDIVIFGGDLFDNYARDRENLDLEYLKEELDRIQASAGKYAVWGNHDYGGGAVRIYEEFMDSCGFELLDDENRLLENYGIVLTGYDDYLLGYTEPGQYSIQDDYFNIIAAHEPVIAQKISTGGEGFLFSGHTHGGQVGIPFLTSIVLPAGSGKFVKGVYTSGEIGTEADISMYTSSGIGMAIVPFRLFNVPEIIAVDFYSTEE